MMKKIAATILLVLCAACMASAQPGSHRPRPAERIEAFKKQYIKEILALSDEDAERFFPVYDAFETEKRALRHELNQLKRGFMAKSDEQLRQDLTGLMNIKEKELALEKRYLNRFMEILSPRQVAALYHAENQFRRKLLERFGEMSDN